MEKPAINPEHVISLQGQEYATYRGVLDLAHSIGLESIRTKLLQVPGADNDHVAIVEAEVRLKDGRVFVDVADASPKNVHVRMAVALIRMASTRAKGRALRDAVNIGEALAEELPEEAQVEEAAARPAGARHAAAPKATPAAAAPAPAPAPSAAPAAPPAAPSARPSAAATAAPAVGYVCTEPGCGRALTQGQQAASTREFGRGLCPACQRKARAANPLDGAAR